MKTIVITGSTDGIGKLTAIKLGKDGHKLLLHGRNSKKLQVAISEVKKLSNNENITGFVSDFSEVGNVEKMLAEITDEVSEIDTLINNAGIFNSPFETNDDGFDIRFAVNFLAPYLLTRGLLPLLKKSASPRVINLSSAAQAAVSIDALKGGERLSAQQAYAQSKLALTMWSFSFEKAHPEIMTVAVNPGSLLNTKMVKEAYGHHWSSADKGADILYRLANLEKFTHSGGNYFDNDKGKFDLAHNDAYDQEKIDRLISATAEILR
ncbi:SDR family NAD(P)-dependent oxidoreductase [Echinicola sediminis]